jgi:hypothetical protein
MTEAKWLSCPSPFPLLDHLQRRAGARKLRLFAVACCRLLGPLLTDPRKQRAVALLERHADGLTSADELRELPGLFDPEESAPAAVAVAHAALSLLAPHLPPDATRDALFAAHYSARAVVKATVPEWESVLDHRPEREPSDAGRDILAAEHLAQSHLLRDTFGNPFRPVTVDPAWLAWQGGTVVSAAQSVYDEHRFDDLPTLAALLKDAGCTHADLLQHLAAPGPHVRGCWVVDVLLGKA